MAYGVKIINLFWLIFFLSSVAIGALLLSLFFFPLRFGSWLFPTLKGREDRALYYFMRGMMAMQPWYRTKIKVTIPDQDGRGLLLISNHRSHLEVFVLLSQVPGVRVLAKASLFKIPFLGLMMKLSRQIRVERGSLQAWVLAMDEVRNRLRLGETVHVFPELTRCAEGFESVCPFAAGPFLAAIQERVKILPMVFRDSDRVWPRGRAGLRFRSHMELESLEPIDASRFTSADELRNVVHQRILEAL